MTDGSADWVDRPGEARVAELSVVAVVFDCHPVLSYTPQSTLPALQENRPSTPFTNYLFCSHCRPA